MQSQELEQRICAHQNVIAELNRLSPEIEAYNMKISRFILDNPAVIGLTYPEVEILMGEKDLAVRSKAIKLIGEELKRRRDIDSPGYRLVYRRITASRVRKILSQCRPKSDNQKDKSFQKECTQENRDEIVSFRATEIEDNAIDYLAKKCSVSRSFLINALLSVEKHYGCALKNDVL